MNVVDKVRKLLALAEGSTEPGEIEQSFLAARRLMAKYKLTNDDIDNISDKAPRVSRILTRWTASAEKNAWIAYVGPIIGKAYCCIAYRHRRAKYAKQFQIGFIGLEDDIQVCNEVFDHAATFVMRKAEELRKELSDRQLNWRDVEKYINTYGTSFADGLEIAFAAQNNASETGLALAVPRAVEGAVANMSHSNIKTRIVSGDETSENLKKTGYSDGLSFKYRKELTDSVS